MKDRYLISCITFIYINSKKEVLNLQEIYREMRRHFENMEKFYEDMNAAIRGIIYHYRDSDYQLFVNVDRGCYKITGGMK